MGKKHKRVIETRIFTFTDFCIKSDTKWIK